MAEILYTDICRKVEDAFEAYIEQFPGDNLTGVAIFKGFEAVTAKVVPRISIMCPRAELEIQEEVIITGNWWVDVQIQVITHYLDEARTSRENKAAEVFDLVIIRNLPARLNNIPLISGVHFYGDSDTAQCQIGWMPTEVERGAIDTLYAETLTGRIYCAPSGGVSS